MVANVRLICAHGAGAQYDLWAMGALICPPILGLERNARCCCIFARASARDFYRQVAVVDLRIGELGLHLVGGIDLVTRHRNPQRGYFAACRREGRNKSIDGIFIETAGWIEAFRWITRWAIDAEWVVEHAVDYRLLDHDFDAASAQEGGWPERHSAWWTEAVVPCRSEPVMHVLPEDRRKIRETDDEEDNAGWIVGRRQTFAMPTLERERLLAPSNDSKRPGLASAFRLANLTPMKASASRH